MWAQSIIISISSPSSFSDELGSRAVAGAGGGNFEASSHGLVFLIMVWVLQSRSPYRVASLEQNIPTNQEIPRDLESLCQMLL